MDSKLKEYSLFKDIIVYAHKNNVKTFSYNTTEYLKDMGTLKTLTSVKRYQTWQG